MAKLLFRLGSLSARRAWYVVAGWLVVLGAALMAFLSFGGALATSFSIPGTETERVNERLAEALPELTGATGAVVFSTDDGAALTPAQRDGIAELLDEVAGTAGVAGVTNPFDAEAARAAQRQQLADGAAQLDAARAQLDAAAALLPPEQLAAQRTQLDAQQLALEQATTLLNAADGIRMVSADSSTAVARIAFDDDMFALAPELKTEIAGMLDGADIAGVEVDYSATIASSIDGLIGVGEVVGVLIAALVLLVMMRAVLPALTPLLSSLTGVGVGVAGSLAFSGVVDMASITPVLGVMLGLAVGIDYSLFILNRHRAQLRAGMPVTESIGLANGTAGNAVVFAGATVVVALTALLVTGIPFLGVMGVVGAACVLVAVLVSVTLTPALLGLLGPRVLSRRARSGAATRRTPAPVVPLRTGRALAAAGLAIVALLTVAVPALSMRLGLPDGSSEPTDTTQYRAYQTIAERFGAGQNAALLVVAEPAAPVAEADRTAAQADIVDRLMAQPDVVAVAPVAVSDDGALLAFQVVPAEGPSSASTESLVHELRALSPLDGGIRLGVAGQSSGNIDVAQKLADALPVYLIVVVGLSLLIMVVVFRSLVVPLVATAGYILSLFAALGATTAVFQLGWLSDVFGVHDPGPLLSFVPIILTGVLFGLAMDYQLFLASGMREAHAHGAPARHAVIAGLRNGRAVVTAAAIIMAAVFGGFVFSHLAMIRPLGFGLAIGVLFDAFVVRMAIVPALMHLVGERAWWLPRWLDRIVPDVDVEGSALERAHPVHLANPDPAGTGADAARAPEPAARG